MREWSQKHIEELIKKNSGGKFNGWYTGTIYGVYEHDIYDNVPITYDGSTKYLKVISLANYKSLSQSYKNNLINDIQNKVYDPVVLLNIDYGLQFIDNYTYTTGSSSSASILQSLYSSYKNFPLDPNGYCKNIIYRECGFGYVGETTAQNFLNDIELVMKDDKCFRDYRLKHDFFFIDLGKMINENLDFVCYSVCDSNLEIEEEDITYTTGILPSFDYVGTLTGE